MIHIDADTQVMLAERKHRPQVVLAALEQNLIPQSRIRLFIMNWWEDTEFPNQQDKVWRKIFKYFPQRKYQQTTTVYRGGLFYDGFSWTTDIQTAQWFAWRNHGFDKWNLGISIPSPIIWRAQVNPNAVIHSTNGRGEKEVIIKYWDKNVWIQTPDQIAFQVPDKLKTKEAA